MSRCFSCDRILTDYEMTRKSAVTGQFFDLCNACFSTIRADVHYRERLDLMHEEDESNEEDLY